MCAGISLQVGQPCRGSSCTPLLDIKPYTARFDLVETYRNGWQDEVDEETARKRGKRGYRA